MGEDLALSLGRVESATLDFKQAVPDLSVIRKAVCALANDLSGHGSGDLLLGVIDAGTPNTVDTSDQTLLRISGVRDEGKLLDRPSMTVNRANYGGSGVIHIHVNATSTPPMRLDGVAWVRVGPTTKRATADDERVLNERRQAALLPFDARPVLETSVRDLDVEMLRATYVTAAVDPDVLEENDRPLNQQLQSLRLLDPAGLATVLGVLLAGFDPTVHIPGAYLQFVRTSVRTRQPKWVTTKNSGTISSRPRAG